MSNPITGIVTPEISWSISGVARHTKLSRPTITKLLNAPSIPRETKLETLDKIAAYYGYRVKVEFEPIEAASLQSTGTL